MIECMDMNNLHRRLKKIQGQVASIDRMIEELNDAADRIRDEGRKDSIVTDKIFKIGDFIDVGGKREKQYTGFDR